jgi:hypothetical protein
MKVEISNLNLGNACPTKKERAFLCIILSLILGWGCYMFASSFNLSELQTDYSQEAVKTYNTRINSVKKKISSLDDSRINLSATLPFLLRKYTSLTNLTLGKAKTDSQIKGHQNDIEKYFGNSYYRKSLLIRRYLDSNKTTSIVTFGKYHSSKKIIDIKIYSNYQIKGLSKNKNGIMYATIKYDLLKNKALSCKTRFQSRKVMIDDEK